jgi:bifunctional DNA-binding transcriptional regulator/antitoxin component of YhaV-PrlF toxin-antitoxin module
MPTMLLYGQSKVFKHGKAKTLYVTIPSKVAEDSAFTIKEGDTVEVKFDKELNAVVIRSKPTTKEHRSS